jgi:hypothetical protein
MKHLFALLIFMGIGLSQEALAQQINHIAIAPNTASANFKGTQYVFDCPTNGYLYDFNWQQALNTNVPYFALGSPDEIVLTIEICDDNGECATLTPNSSHLYATGDQADFFVDPFCFAHVEIWHP